MHLPHWIKGGILGIAYVLVVFLIKATCVPDWCFADIFLPTILEPLILVDYLLPKDGVAFIGKNLFVSAMILWFVFGAIISGLYNLFKNPKYPEIKEESSQEKE